MTERKKNSKGNHRTASIHLLGYRVFGPIGMLSDESDWSGTHKIHAVFLDKEDAHTYALRKNKEGLPYYVVDRHHRRLTTPGVDR